jgi:hypothetical protein
MSLFTSITPWRSFRIAYKRIVVPLGDKSFWPAVDIGVVVGVPLAKRPVGRQRKNRFESCLEGGSEKRPSANEKEKIRKMIQGQFRCPNYEELGHRKNSPKYNLNGTKEMQDPSFTPIILFLLCL